MLTEKQNISIYLEVRHGRVDAMSDSLRQLIPPQIPDPVREIVAFGNIPEQTVTPDAPVLVVAPAEVKWKWFRYV